MTEYLLILAQNGPPPPGGSPWSGMLPLFLLMGFIIYFVMLRPQSKERKRREEMLKAVKKTDRVVTIGGIVGTVVQVKDDEITLKVDESNNTKITFLRSAIQRVTSTQSTTQSGAK